LGVLRAEDGVVAAQSAVEVALRGLVGEVEAGGAVVEEHHVARGEEVVRQELAQRRVVAVARGHEVARVTVQDELRKRAGDVLPGELLRPGGVVGGVAVERQGGVHAAFVRCVFARWRVEVFRVWRVKAGSQG